MEQAGSAAVALRSGNRRAPPGSSVAERLAFLSMPEPNSGCQLWLGKLAGNGYPQMNVDGKTRGAHRVALERKLGRPLMPHEWACHKCDVIICINEDHLFPGTHLENMADMRLKGRGPRGERGSKAKLTASQVLAILSDSRRNPVIAAEFGVSPRTVSDIRLGKRWAHLGRQI